MGVHLLIIQMADDRWRMPNGIRDPACELHASALLFLQWTLFLFGKVCSESLPILEQSINLTPKWNGIVHKIHNTGLRRRPLRRRRLRCERGDEAERP